MNIIYSSLHKVSGRSPLTDFSFSITETPLTVSPSNTPSVLADGNIETISSAGLTNNYKINTNKHYPHDVITYESASPAIATVDASGNVTRVSNGTSAINIKSKYGMKQVTRPISTTSGSYVNFLSYVSGTLARHIEDAIFGMIDGKTPDESTLRYFSSTSYPAPNPTRFTGSLDFSAFSYSGPNMLLISPRHVIGSHTSATGQIYFRANDGTIVQRTVTSILPLSTNNTESDQHWVGLLDTPVPTNGVGAITPLKLLGSSFSTKLNLCKQSTYKLQMLRKKQAGPYQKVEVIEGTIFDNPFMLSLSLRKSTRTPYSNWTSDIIDGDSNGAVFLPIDETGGTNYSTVLVGSINTSGGTRHYANHITEIQTLMNTLQSGYTLSVANLNFFPTV